LRSEAASSAAKWHRSSLYNTHTDSLNIRSVSTHDSYASDRPPIFSKRTGVSQSGHCMV
jgi:hypothetical protein